MISAFLLGALYAALLWLTARTVAASRGLELGAWPRVTILLCGVAAAAVSALLPHERALFVSTSLIGTIVCAVVDARTGLIFDVLSLGMIAVAVSIAAATRSIGDGAVAAVIVGGALLALYLATGRRGIGLGDVKLSSALALGYGVQLSVVAIGMAFVLGAGYAGILLGCGRAKRSDALRFGPFIAGGAVVGLTINVLGYRW